MHYSIQPYQAIAKADWDGFCDQCPGAWYFHTTGWIDYTMSMGFGSIRENLGFVVMDGRRVLALVPIIKEVVQGVPRLSYGGFNTPFPAFLDTMGVAERKAVEKVVFDQIRTIPEVQYACFAVSPLTDEVLQRTLPVNPLPKHGFHDTTIATHILDLCKEDEDVIFRGFRKGCKSDIKTAQKRGFTVLVVDHENYEARHFDRYRIIHHAAVGRQTRSDESWERQRSWLQSGRSVLALLEKDGDQVSAAFVNTYKGRAYYQSAATLPAFEGAVGIGHLLQWEIIRHLKKKGFTWYEIGWNYHPNISQEVADEKLLGISRFKGGFGAELFPLFRGEFFASMDYMKQVYAERLAAFAAMREQSTQATVAGPAGRTESSTAVPAACVNPCPSASIRG